jgi:hypothetical protein
MKKIIAIVLALAVLASSAVFAANAASKVTGVKQIDASATSFKIAWNDDFGVNRYKIEFSANGASGDYSEDTIYASNFEHYVFSRQAGRTYYVKVTPYIDNRWATEKTSDPYPVATAPNAPSNIKQTGATANSFTISWSGSYGATAYGVYKKVGSVESLIGTTTSTSYTVNKVSNKKELDYNVVVRALRNVNGYNAASNYTSIYNWDLKLVPSAPPAPKVTDVFSGLGVVYFKNPNVAFQKGYDVNIYKANKKAVYTSGTGWRYEGLKKGQFYKAKCRAWTSVGTSSKHLNGKWSKFSYFSLGCSSIRASANKNSVKLKWSKVKGGKVKYDIYVSKNSNSGLKKFKKNVKGTSLRVTKFGKKKLSRRTFYYFYVKPKLKVGKKWVASPYASYFYASTK